MDIEEIKIILRACDPFIAKGGRSLFSKFLKGSKEKKILELNLDKEKYYGYYNNLTIYEILNKVDELIANDYLKIEYFNKLPLLIYSDKGWEIEKEIYAEEMFNNLFTEDIEKIMNYNPICILIMLDKILKTKDLKYLDKLEEMKATNPIKKIRKAINTTIASLKINK